MIGYIKLHRKLIGSKVWINPNWLKVFIYCLLKANHKKAFVPIKTGRGETVIEVQRGQFVFGRIVASKELLMSPSTVRNIMTKLAQSGMVKVQSRTHYSLVSIVNYSEYQGITEIEGQPKDNQRTTKGQPKDTNKNDKKEKNEEEYTHTPAEIISKKVMGISSHVRETWEMQFGINGELDNEAESFADWWIAKNCVDLPENQIYAKAKNTAAVVFQSAFKTSWLKNLKKKEKNSAKKESESGYLDTVLSNRKSMRK